MGSFRQRLLSWYDRNRRDLPWRRTGDPWCVWVSEVMLQQTRVEAVREVFPRFVARYPAPADWAAVSDDELLRAWRGLGYYRRARLLREGARQVVEDHGGRVPGDPDQLGELAGIGPYTRGAIASIAFDRALPAIDGNVERVLARHAGIREDIKGAVGRRRVRELVEQHLDRGRPGDFNQALMDLGATVCTPRSPRCQACPLAGDCTARAQAAQGELPVLPRPRAPVDVRARAVLVERRGGRVLGVRIARGEINEGQIELPGSGILVDRPDRSGLAASVRERHGLEVEIGRELVTIRHGITHHRIRLTVHAARPAGRVPRTLRSFRPGDPDVPWSTPSRKALTRLAVGPVERL